MTTAEALDKVNKSCIKNYFQKAVGTDQDEQPMDKTANKEMEGWLPLNKNLYRPSML